MASEQRSRTERDALGNHPHPPVKPSHEVTVPRPERNVDPPYCISRHSLDVNIEMQVTFTASNGIRCASSRFETIRFISTIRPAGVTTQNVLDDGATRPRPRSVDQVRKQLMTRLSAWPSCHPGIDLSSHPISHEFRRLNPLKLLDSKIPERVLSGPLGNLNRSAESRNVLVGRESFASPAASGEGQSSQAVTEMTARWSM